jgi:hypothetical protein
MNSLQQKENSILSLAHAHQTPCDEMPEIGNELQNPGAVTRTATRSAIMQEAVMTGGLSAGTTRASPDIVCASVAAATVITAMIRPVIAWPRAGWHDDAGGQGGCYQHTGNR